MPNDFSIPELARQEAERAEAENPDVPPDPEPEPEPQPEPQPEPPSEPAPQPTAGGLTPEQVAELDRAAAAYFKRVAKAFGGELPPPCRACNGIGFDLSGGEPAPELRQHERYETCPGCEGKTLVKTGALAGDAVELPCPDCGGRGYRDKLASAAPSVPVLPVGVPVAVAAEGAPAWMGNAEVPTTAR